MYLLTICTFFFDSLYFSFEKYLFLAAVKVFIGSLILQFSFEVFYILDSSPLSKGYLFLCHRIVRKAAVNTGGQMYVTLFSILLCTEPPWWDFLVMWLP